MSGNGPKPNRQQGQSQKWRKKKVPNTRTETRVAAANTTNGNVNVGSTNVPPSAKKEQPPQPAQGKSILAEVLAVMKISESPVAASPSQAVGSTAVPAIRTAVTVDHSLTVPPAVTVALPPKTNPVLLASLGQSSVPPSMNVRSLYADVSPSQRLSGVESQQSRPPQVNLLNTNVDSNFSSFMNMPPAAPILRPIGRPTPIGRPLAAGGPPPPGFPMFLHPQQQLQRNQVPIQGAQGWPMAPSQQLPSTSVPPQGFPGPMAQLPQRMPPFPHGFGLANGPMSAMLSPQMMMNNHQVVMPSLHSLTHSNMMPQTAPHPQNSPWLLQPRQPARSVNEPIKEDAHVAAGTDAASSANASSHVSASPVVEKPTPLSIPSATSSEISPLFGLNSADTEPPLPAKDPKLMKLVVPLIKRAHKNPSYQSRLRIIQLSNELLRSLLPTQDLFPHRENLRRRIEQAVQTVYPTARCHLFGSTVTRLGTQTSDMDICLAIPTEDLPPPVTIQVEIEEKDDNDEKPDESSPPLGSRIEKHKDSIASDSETEGTGLKPRFREEIKSSATQVVERLAPVFEKDFMDILALPKARVPIVKLRDPLLRIGVDVGVNNFMAVENSKLIRAYVDIDSRLPWLCYLVKHWAKARKINDPYRGTLSSYAYVLMIISFLQQRKPPILPCLQTMPIPPEQRLIIEDYDCSWYRDIDSLRGFGNANQETVADLLPHFLRLWAHEFDYKEHVVCVRLGGFVTKVDKGWTRSKGRDRHWISIEDPFELTHDLGRVCDPTALHEIRGEFMRAHRVLIETGDLNEMCHPYTEEWRGS